MRLKTIAGGTAVLLLLTAAGPSAPGRRPDHRPPPPVTGLTATAVDGLNRIQVAWTPPADPALDLYRVYGSTEPSFRAGPDTLVGEAALPHLRLDGLGAGETWYYKVTATDTWGNESRTSPTVAATSGTTLRYEGEDLVVERTNTGVSTPNAMRGYDGEWSDFGQVFVRATGTEDFAHLSFDLPEAGTYTVHTAYTKASDYGLQTLAVDGHVLGSPVDGYSSSGVTYTGDVVLGAIPMAAGTHVVTLAPVGKNSRSRGYQVGVDYVDLELTGPAPVDAAAPGPVAGTTATAVAGSTTLRLGWEPAADDVLVTGYEVYGSTEAGFEPGDETLLATVPWARFDHAGLPLRQAWHYVVRAVDGAGNPGPYSAEFGGVSGDSLTVEAEDMTQVATTGTFKFQNNCCGQSFSGGRQLRFIADAEGETAELEFTVAIGAEFEVAAWSLYARDYGIVQYAIDGVPVGSPADLYAASYRIDDTPLGVLDLAAGEHRLTMTIVGRNPASPGFQVSLDRLSLTLTG